MKVVGEMFERNVKPIQNREGGPCRVDFFSECCIVLGGYKRNQQHIDGQLREDIRFFVLPQGRYSDHFHQVGEQNNAPYSSLCENIIMSHVLKTNFALFPIGGLFLGNTK
jgi:hypothetical protein